MTATPIEEEFILTELKDLPVVEVNWPNTVTVDIQPVITAKPVKEVCRFITAALSGKLFGNLHFFVNSVDFIADAIKLSNLQPHQVRVVCSNNTSPGRGRKSNQKKLGLDYPIATTTDPIKQINFYTSTSFEGCDIYDTDGRTYIVSDKTKSHTLLDISTLIIQICGRIRDSHYQTHITHIFSETRYSHFTTFEEFKESSKKQIQSTKTWIIEINSMTPESKRTTIGLIQKKNKAGLNEMYIRKVEDNLYFDENRVKLDMVNFKITHHLYNARVTLQEEYQKYGFNVLTEEIKIYTDELAANPKARISFKDLFEEYVTLRNEIPVFNLGNFNERLDLIEQEKPLVKEAFDQLGAKKIRSMNYNVSNIKKAITKNKFHLSTDSKILHCLADAGLKQGITKPARECKSILQDIYNALEIQEAYGKTRKAKATDLSSWFEIKRHSPKIAGKSTDCITLIRTKIIFE